MEVQGKLVICDRCGKTVLIKPVDGIYALLDDWKYIDELGDLCPECLKEYREIIGAFACNNGSYEIWSSVKTHESVTIVER